MTETPAPDTADHITDLIAKLDSAMEAMADLADRLTTRINDKEKDA